MRGGARSGALRWAAAALALAILGVPGAGRAGPNLLNNGDFTRGSGESVDEWRTDAWVLTAGTTDYEWIAPHHGEPAEVEISSRRDNDARWVQGLTLGPGWYHISVEARTRNVLHFFTGASVSVLEDGMISHDLRGDNDWTPVGFYLHVGRHGADVEVALRLGGYMNLTRGQAWFRRARVVKITGPPPAATPLFDLSAIRKTETTGPIGHLWTLVGTFLALGGTALIGWRMMAEQPPLQQRRAERIGRRRRA
jgi:hypothetical protein